MSRRSTTIRTANRLRTTTKIAIALVSTTIAGLVTLLIIILNFSKQEKALAESPMVFNIADVIQDTATVLRGSINQKVIGLMIETSGTANALKLSAIKFSAKGTTEPIHKNIENARLWYTNKEKHFNTSKQIGASILQISSRTFEIETNLNLSTGKNYFWLTFDIKPEAQIKNGTIDAQCESIKIGANTFLPLISSPSGKKPIAINIPYFSTGNLSISNAQSWNSKRDGSGEAPQKLESPLNSYFIQGGHRMINENENKLTTIVIEKNALLKADKQLHLKTMILEDGGTYRQDFSLNEKACFENFKMENGGNYIHNNTGNLPSQSCTFGPRSNQCFYQFGASTFSTNQIWGNVLINSTSNENLNINGNFKNVQGDFEIRKTGSNNYAYAMENDSINVAGSFIISGGNFFGAMHTARLSINVGEDFIMKDGCFYDTDGKQNATTELNIHGDVLFVGGNFDFSKSKGANSEINILDLKAKTVYWMQKGGNIKLGKINIHSGKELVLKGNKLGDIAFGNTLTVNNGAKLMCGQTPVIGEGKFVLKENATLGIGSIKGINSIADDGNILTKERYFDSGANYIYHTNTTPQATGSFITQPVANTVRSLMIKKDISTNEVILTTDLDVSEQVLVSMGSFNYGKNKLNLMKLTENTKH